MKKHNLLFLLVVAFLQLLGLQHSTYAQAISTEGKEFYAGFMQINPSGTVSLRFIISSKLGATGTISMPLNAAFTPINFTVAANGIYYSPDPGIGSTNAAALNGTAENKVFYIKSDDNDISVTAVHFSTNRTEASAVLPVTSLGTNTEYYVNVNQGAQTASEFIMVGMVDNTSIDVTIGATTTNYNLQRGQLIQIKSSAGGDLTGTFIKSAGTCKPFAVFAGTTNSIVACPITATGNSSSQHTFEQQYPIHTWGKNYITTPYEGLAGYWFRILASEDDTSVDISDNAGSTNTITLNKGESTLQSSTNIPRCITANKPVSVIQISPNSECSGRGDASLLVLNPLNQTTTQTTFNTILLGGAGNHYVNVIMKTADIGLLRCNGLTTAPNGQPLLNYFATVNDCNDYSYAKIPISIGTNTLIQTTLSATKEFVAFAYGHSGVDIYSYSVGASFENQAYNFTIDPTIAKACDPNRTFSFAGSGINIASYEWDFGDGNTGTGQNATHTYAASGFYDVKMTVTFTTGGTGCNATGTIIKQVKIYDTSPASASIGVNRTVCQNGTLTLSAPNGQDQTYEWFENNLPTGIITQTYSVNTTTAGTKDYYVKITRGGTCIVNSNIVTVNVVALPTATISPASGNLCTAGGVTLTANAGAGLTYKWVRRVGTVRDTLAGAGGLQGITANTFDAITAGFYSVVVINANGCRSVSTESDITGPPAIALTVTSAGSKTYFCKGSFLTLTLTPNPTGTTYTYQWQRKVGATFTDVVGQTAITIDANVAGEYRAILTNTANGCNYTSPTFTVEEKPLPSTKVTLTGNPTATSATICTGDDITLNAPAAPVGSNYTYQWFLNGGATVVSNNQSYTLPNMTAGTFNYTVKITDVATQCDSTSVNFPVTINPSPNPIIGVIGGTFLCSGATATLTTQPVTAGETWTYQWFRGTTPIAGATNSTYAATISGSYTVQITTNKGCVRTTLNPMEITVNPTPNATVTVNPVGKLEFCDTDNTTLVANPTPAGQTWTYNWDRNGAAHLVSNTASQLVVTQSGAYRLRITTPFGCADTSAVFNIIVNPMPDVTITTDKNPLCQGETTLLRANLAPAGQTWTYQWLLGGNPIPAANKDTLRVNATGDYTVKIVTDKGCEKTTATPIAMVVNPLPVVAINGVATSYCSNDALVDLTGKGTPVGGIFTLTQGTVTQTVTAIDPPNLTAGAYTLKYTYTNPTTNCTNSVTQNVFINNVLPVTITNLNDKYCINDADIVLTGSGVGGTGQFFVNDNPTTVFSPSNLGILGVNHTVRYVYTYGTGCDFVVTKTVQVNPLPVVSITGLREQYCLNDKPIKLTSTQTPTGGTVSFLINGSPALPLTAPEFNPTTLGSGNHVVKLIYTDPNGCENQTTKTVEVLNPTALTFNGLGTKYCSNDPELTLNASPAGGKFYVNDALETKLRPQVLGAGVHKVQYIFTAAGVAACTDTITRSVTIVAPVKAFYTNPPKKDYCVTDADVLLQPQPVGAKVYIDGVLAPASPTIANAYIFSPSTLGVKATPYRVWAIFEDANLCKDTLKSEVAVNPLPVVTMTGVNAEYCLNDNAFTPIVNPAGGIFKINGNVVPSPINPRTLGVGTFTLVYEYKDAKSCMQTAQRTFTVKPLPTVDITNTLATTYCTQDTPFFLNATPLGGTFTITGSPSATGILNPANNSVTFNPSLLGVQAKVTIIYTYTAPNGCTNADTTYTSIIAPPKVNLGNDIETCSAAGSVLLKAFDPSHDSNISYTWTNVGTGAVLATTPSLRVDKSGTYRVRVADARACSPVFDDIKVTINPNPKVDLGANLTVCGNQQVVLKADKDRNNTGNFKYLWSNGATTDSIVIKSDTVRGIRTYWVKVTDENATSKCSSADTIQIFFNDVPVVDLGKDRSICNPKDVPYTIVGQDVSHTSGTKYKWTNPFAANPSTTLATTANYVITEPGAYTLTVTNAQGCSKSDTVQILFDSDPNIKILGANNGVGVCQLKDTLYLQATNVLNYDIQWSGAGVETVSSDKLTVIVNKSGRYTVTVRDRTKPTRCNSTLSVDVFIADFPAVTIKPSMLPNATAIPQRRMLVCQDSTVLLNAADTSHRTTFKYEWRNLTTNQVVGTAAQLTLTYTAQNTFDPVRYAVTVTPPSGCITRDTVTVQYQPKATARIDDSYPRQICLGETFILRASGGDTYKWTSTDKDATTIPSNAQVAFRPKVAGTYTYTVEVSNANSTICKPTKVSVTVVVNPAMVTKLARKNIRLCETATTEVDAFLPEHPLATQYTWRILTTGEVVGNNSRIQFTFGALKPQPTYSTVAYEVAIRDAITGCIAKDTVRVTFVRKAKPVIVRNFPTQICLGDSVRLTAIQGGTYRWSTGQTGENITVKPTATGRFTYWVASRFDTLCEEGTDTIRLVVNPLPRILANANKNLKVCVGDRVTLTALGGVRYVWQHDGATTASTTVTPTKDTKYVVIGFNEFGCSATDTVLVKVTPRKELPPRIILCEGETTTLDATHPETGVTAKYLWNSGDERPTIPIFKAGTYIVTISVENCTYKDTTEVIYRQKPRIALGADTILCFAERGEIENRPYRVYQHTINAILTNREAGEVYYYDWRMKGSNNLIDGGVGRLEANNIAAVPISRMDTSYVVRIRAGSTNCETYDTIRVHVVCDARVKIPTAFTPNNDKLNDTFAPITSDLTGIFIQVLHKWGDVVYEKFIDPKDNKGWDGRFDEKEGWDGTFNGSPVPIDDYQYVIVYWSKDRKGNAKRQQVTGTVQVIREYTR